MVFLTQLAKEELLTQLNHGVILMLLGMGTVFVFLTLLVFVTKGLSALVMKFESKRPASAPSAGAVSTIAAPASEADIAAAIAVAWAKANE